MDIDIITPYYNASKFIADYLCSIGNLQVPAGFRVKLYLIDNASLENESEIIELCRYLSNGVSVEVLYYSDKQSSYAARNYGVRKSQGDIIFFTDIDCNPAEDWLVRGLEGVIPGRITSGAVDFYSPSGSFIDRLSGKFDSLYFLRNDFNSKFDTGVTANACIYRVDFDRVGFFDEKVSGADHAYFSRAKDCGLEFFYNDRSIVFHPTRGFHDIIIKLNRICLGKVQNGYRVSIFKEFLKFIVNAMFLNLLRTGAFKELKLFEVLPIAFISFVFNSVCRFCLVKHKIWSSN